MAVSKAATALALLSILCFSFPATTSAAQFDFFRLTLKWPGGVCGRRCDGKACCIPTNGSPAVDFLIESMQTYDSVAEQPIKNCNSSCRFYVNQLWDVISQMNLYWSDLRCPSRSSVDMWKEAWCTYGVCSTLGQKDYFQNALALRDRANLVEALAVNDIVPSSDKYYKLTDIETALQANIGFSYEIECRRSARRWKSYEYYLAKIHICVSANGKSIISCPYAVKGNCGSEVKFIPFSVGGALEGFSGNEEVIKMPSGEDFVL